MPVNTVSVATAVTPIVIETYVSHYLNRKPLRQKPTAHITYHEGLELIRRFLHYSSFHTVEEIQAFTSQWVPVPTWVHVEVLEIPNGLLGKSAEYLQAQLGPEGIEQVGGKTWWQWRRDNTALKAEWIEMRKDYEERKKVGGAKGQRIMLYVHGGAYYFGSVDEHRYQMQRHARKLKARVLAPRYRLAPQFPFPCGLMDCLAAYLYLLEEKHDPSTIVLAGDSAGGGMVVSMLVTLRDQGIPLPAGAILISPWVDLTHSFPSLGGDGKMDYIPTHGFVHKPSASWPPPNADDLLGFERNSPRLPQKEKRSPRVSFSRPSKEEREAQKEVRMDRVRGFSVRSDRPDADALLTPPEDNVDLFVSAEGKYSIGPKSILSVQLDGSRIEVKDQIQLYAANHLLTHPLVSPALQPSLGGLPPLLIQVGGGELLRDEQIYLAHKAASPLSYLPPPSNHLTAEYIQSEAARYRPTNVQLQVWDDLCHVAPTLSFTRPAKYMYRSIAQFGAWALARAQKTAIDILDDDSVSIISTGSSDSVTTESDSKLSPDEIKLTMPQSAQYVGFESISKKVSKGDAVGKAGDPLPPFEKHMIRQRIDRHGTIHPLPPPPEIPALNIPSIDIGVPKPGPINKWMKAQKQWNGKFAKQKLKIQKKRLKDMEMGYEGFDGETPPPTALAGRRVKGMKAEKRKKKSWGMALWSLWGSKHDEMTIVREEKADQTPDQEPSTTDEPPTPPIVDGAASSKPEPTSPKQPPKDRRRTFSRTRPSNLKLPPPTSRSRSHSRHSNVIDKGQITLSMEDLTHLAPVAPGLADATVIAPERRASLLPFPTSPIGTTPRIEVEDMSRPQSPETLIPLSHTLSTRPTRGGVAYPFRLKVEGEEGKEVNASTVTLQSLSVGEWEEPGTPGLVVDGEQRVGVDGTGEKVERPCPERFVTAGVGDFGHVDDEAIGGNRGRAEKEERPGVDRPETAHEDLSTLASDRKGKNA
ncbi:alpha/beta-hydrolase [Lindgomyces ingoldianus]|uniref:Alpha/beta-hydrolase n=1 Tax=Lindgomyces ingoldianus TaxID=673940 RepID=A0ACB6R072_9PLEO|nr:alpha/beta-hydrolase [Lindgomyces ingoldianus]KAF2472576.1 alpha/beta-hydrolase [Lindgomyces ingoldianus]